MIRRTVVLASLILSASLLGAPSANALIHEIIGAACRSGGEEVVPPGQAREGGASFVRALRATGLIASIDMSVPGQVTVHFDPDKPASKFVSAGFDLTIEDGFGDGVDLILSPLIVPDEGFPAHANCANLRG